MQEINPLVIVCVCTTVCYVLTSSPYTHIPSHSLPPLHTHMHSHSLTFSPPPQYTHTCSVTHLKVRGDLQRKLDCQALSEREMMMWNLSGEPSVPILFYIIPAAVDFIGGCVIHSFLCVCNVFRLSNCRSYNIMIIYVLMYSGTRHECQLLYFLCFYHLCTK